jgi:hypothetical protein
MGFLDDLRNVNLENKEEDNFLKDVRSVDISKPKTITQAVKSLPEKEPRIPFEIAGKKFDPNHPLVQGGIGLAEGLTNTPVSEVHDPINAEQKLTRTIGEVLGLTGPAVPSVRAANALVKGAGAVKNIAKAGTAGAIFGGGREALSQAGEGEVDLKDFVKKTALESVIWGGITALPVGAAIGLKKGKELAGGTFLGRKVGAFKKEIGKRVSNFYNGISPLYTNNIDEAVQVVDEVAPDAETKVKIIENTSRLMNFKEGPAKANEILTKPQPSKVTPGFIKGRKTSTNDKLSNEVSKDTRASLLEQGVKEDQAAAISNDRYSMDAHNIPDEFLPAWARGGQAQDAFLPTQLQKSADDIASTGSKLAENAKTGDVTGKSLFPKRELSDKARDFKDDLEKLKNLDDLAPEEQAVLKNTIETKYANNVGKEYVASGNQKVWTKKELDDITEEGLLKEVDDLSQALFPTKAADVVEEEARRIIATNKLGEKVSQQLNSIGPDDALAFLNRFVSDVSGNVRTTLKKEGPLGELAANYHRAIAGANYNVHHWFNKADAKVFSGLDEAGTSDLYLLIRSMADKDLALRRPDISRRLGHNSIEAYDSVVSKISSKPNGQDLVARAEEYFNFQRNLLKLRLDEGLINQQTFDELVKNRYAGRSYLLENPEVFDPTVEAKVFSSLGTGRTVQVSDSGIFAINEGNFKLADPDARFTMFENATRTFNRVYKNRANTAMGKLATDSPDNAMGMKLFKPTDKAPDGFTKFFFWEGGEQKAFIMQDKYAREWVTGDSVLDGLTAEMLSWAVGTAPLKAAATGLNPAFGLVKNPLMDTFLQAFATRERSTFLPQYLWQQGKAMGRTYKELLERKGPVFDLWINNGGPVGRSLTKDTASGKKAFVINKNRDGESIVSSGRLGKTGRQVANLLNQVGRPGNFMEDWMRISIFSDALNNRNYWELAEAGLKNSAAKEEAKRVLAESIQVSRGYIDFQVAGSGSRFGGKFIPYLEAGIRGAASMGKALREDPMRFALMGSQIMAVQYAMFEGAYRLYGHDGFKKVLSGISDSTITNGFVMPLYGLSDRDEKHNIRYGVLNIPIEPIAGVFTGVTAMMFEEMKYGTVRNKAAGQMFDILDNISPVRGSVSDITPPIVNALATYKNNQNLYFGSPEVRGRRKGEFEFDEKTGQFWKDVGGLSAKVFGKGQGLSPKLMERATSQIFTSSNPVIDAMGGAYAMARHGDSIFDQEFWAGGEIKKLLRQKKIPFADKLISFTSSVDDNLFDFVGKTNSEIAAIDAEYTLAYNDKLELFMNGHWTEDDMFDYIASHNLRQSKRLKRLFNKDRKFLSDQTVDPIYRNYARMLKSAPETAVARARLYQKIVNEKFTNDQQRKEFEDFTTKIGGIWSNSFRDELDRLNRATGDVSQDPRINTSLQNF